METVEESETKKSTRLRIAAIVGIFALAIFLTWLVWRNVHLTTELAQSRDEFVRAEKAAETLEEKVARLTEALEEAEATNENLEESLEDEEEKNDELEETVDDITDTVGDLTDYAMTDPEILKKYSKVYFLNENYIPADLTLIPEEYRFDEGETPYIRSKVWPQLEELLEDAEEDEIELRVVSAYRSFSEQKDLKGHYETVYGDAAADQFSADQGYSEHQLGTTVDVALPGGALSASFASTAAYDWLAQNAYEYGFVLSYPEDNGYYRFEPWHWRFVGEALAEDLHEEGDHFYDWDQREIDEYRGRVFE